MVMTNFQKVKTFMESFGQEVKDKPDVPPEDIVQLRLNLINEEFIEIAFLNCCSAFSQCHS